MLLHAYLHHRVGYLHDVYLAGGYGELGALALGGGGGYQRAACGVEADGRTLGGTCDADDALVALHLDAACRSGRDGGASFT